MHLPDFFTPVESFSGEDEPSNSKPSLDHGTDELPFNPLGGRRFEILGYLLELKNSDEDTVVTLVQAAGDKGRDLLIHRNGVLIRVIQCKNQLAKLGRPDVFVELVKLLLFNEVEKFLPDTPLTYEIWVPGGLTQRADSLIAEWPNVVETSEVLAAFQKVTATYKTLEHFRWEEQGPTLIERLKSQFRLNRENGITLSQRVRQNLTVYQRFFQGVVVMPLPDVDLYLDKKLAPRVAEIVRLHAEVSIGPSVSAIDSEIDEAAAYINNNNPQAAASLLERLKEKQRSDLTLRQLYRIEANLGAALFRLGKAEQAARYFLAAAPFEPEDERANTNEVFAHFLLKEDRRAHELAEDRLKKFPNSGRMLAIWITTAPEGVAAATLEAAVPESLSCDAEVNVALSRKMLQSGLPASALAYARKAQDSAPEWAQSQLTCAHCAIAFNLLPAETQDDSFRTRSQINDEGILAAGRAQELARASYDDLTESQAFAARCELYLLAGNDKAAIEDAKSAFLLNPKEVSNLLGLAQTQLVQNKLEVGIATMEQAFDLDARPEVRMLLSRALRARGKQEDLRRSVDVLEGIRLPDLPVVMRAPAAISYVQGLALVKEWTRASSYIEEIRDAIDEATWRALSAFVLNGTQHAQDSEGRATESVKATTNSTHPFTREFLARILMSQGRFSDALPLYQELFRSGSPTFDAMQLIECAGRLNRDELVLDTFDEIHRRTVVDWRLLEIELHYLHQFDVLKAIDRLNAFLERNPTHKLARLHRSGIAWEIGRNELVSSSLEDLPSVDELPLSYIRIALKVLSLGQDRAEVMLYAYHFLKKHFDKAEAHGAMIFSVIGLPHDSKKDPNLPVVIENAAVGYRELPDGPVRWTVLVKSDVLDANFEERSVDDLVSQDLLGKKVGDQFVLASGLQDRVGEIVQILPKEVRRFQDSLAEMPVRFPSERGNFQSVTLGEPGEIDSGIATFFESVRRRAEHAKEVQEIYRMQPIPVHLYADRFGTNAYEAMLQLAGMDTMQVKCCSGDSMALEAAVQVFTSAKSVVLDLSAIATFRLLELEDLLTPDVFVISHDSLVELRETLVNDFPGQQGGTMVYQDGRYTMFEESGQVKKRRLEADYIFFEKVRAGAAMKPSLTVASVEIEQRETLFKFLGKYGFETVMLATDPESVLLTDDLIQGELAVANYGIRRSWTHAYLIHLRRIGKISQARFVEAAAKLIGMQYSNIAFNSAEILACARLAKYDPAAWPFKQAAQSFAVIENPVAVLVRISLGFFLLTLQLPVVPQTAGVLVTTLFEQMWKNPDARPILLGVRRISQQIFGLNYPAERTFNEAFDFWQLNRDPGLLG